jgi:tetratricopeptide (TPR) repeat protein
MKSPSAECAADQRGMTMHRKNLRLSLALAVFVVLTLPFTAPRAVAQAATGKIHGQVTDPTGAPVKNGTISLYPGGMSSPTQEAKYNLPVDETGAYHGDNIAPDTYTVIYRAPNTPKDKVVDQFDGVKITAGNDTQQDFDMSREAYLAKLPEEERKQIEETKAKNASIMKENSQIKNLNADLKTARDDDKANNFAAAAALMQKDTTLKPDAGVLWVELGIAQKGLKQWPDADTSLQKGLALDKADKKPNPGLDGAAENTLGEVQANEGKYPDAQATYDLAAKDDPTQAAMYYTNEAIMMDRFGQIDATVAAADKAIAASPNNPIPYYLKGKALINKATVDPKTQKIIAPDGCAEAYQKYLDLAPNGPFANDAKSVLQELSQTQSSSYNAKKKH